MQFKRAPRHARHYIVLARPLGWLLLCMYKCPVLTA
jgi:hypothetical protein